MIRIITVLYILCSVYTTNPDKTTPAFSQNFIAGMQSNNLLIQQTPDQPEPSVEDEITIPDAKDIDYLEGLKTLGFLKEESEDKNLNIRNAVIRFQSSCNIQVDGKWNEKCMTILGEIINKDTFNYPDTVETPPSESKWITINKTKRILTFYENKTVLKKYPIAVGNPPSLTPGGKFTVVSRVVDPTWGGGGYAKPIKGGSPNNPLGYRWMGLSYKDGNRLGIHGNNSPYSIGKNISHGCIRMINTDVEELFEQVPLSAEVWIGTEKELGKWGVVQPEYKNE